MKTSGRSKVFGSSRFEVGEVVQSCVSAQGMTEGVWYTVAAVHVETVPMFGSYVTYDPVNGGSHRVEGVANGHLLLSRVDYEVES